MKYIKNVHIVASPLQLMNCIEAIKHFRLYKNILIIYIDNLGGDTLRQLENLKKKIHWEHVLYIKRPVGKVETLFFPVVYFAKLNSLRYTRVDFIFSGYSGFNDYALVHIINTINAQKIYFVDDGAAVLRLTPFKPLNYRDYFYLLRRGYCCYKLKVLNVQLFTAFKKIHESFEVTKNEYNYFKALRRQNNKLSNVVLFIGQPRGSIVQEGFYKEAFRSILTYNKGSEIIYIPHRRESTLYWLQEFQQKDGIQIINVETNIELWLLEQKFIPKVVYTFFSSAAVVLKKLLPQLCVKFIYIPNPIHKHPNRIIYEKIIEEYLLNDIEMVELDMNCNG
jgi:hypothetical protein